MTYLVSLALTVIVLAIGWLSLLAGQHDLAWACGILALPLCLVVSHQ
jgi:hypothetical protein